MQQFMSVSRSVTGGGVTYLSMGDLRNVLNGLKGVSSTLEDTGRSKQI